MVEGHFHCTKLVPLHPQMLITNQTTTVDPLSMIIMAPTGAYSAWYFNLSVI